MRFFYLFLTLLLIALPAVAADASPKFTSVAPENGAAGTEFVVQGENLTKDLVGWVYFTDGKNDSKCEIKDQQAKTVKIKAPADIKPGRYSLMILTADKSRFIEQPVKVNIQ